MKFLVNKQEIIRIDSDRIIAGTQNFVEAQFDFDDDWNELMLTVCFKNGDTRRAVCNVHSGEAFFVPWEVLHAGNLYIYVEGYDGNVRVTTAKMKKPVVINKNGFFKCDALNPPSASVYDMLLQAYSLAQKSVDGLLESAAKGVFDGKGLEFVWEGTRLGVKKQGDEEYSFIDLKGDKGNAGSIKFIVVTELPTENIDTSAIYMKPLSNPAENSTYEEYIYVNGLWEFLGSTSVDVNLNNFIKNTDYATSTTAGIIKTQTVAGLETDANGVCRTSRATEKEIDARLNQYKPIVPFTVEYAVKSVTYDKEEIDGKIGDIDSALDTIISLQEALIGGGNV